MELIDKYLDTRELELMNIWRDLARKHGGPGLFLADTTDYMEDNYGEEFDKLEKKVFKILNDIRGQNK